MYTLVDEKWLIPAKNWINFGYFLYNFSTGNDEIRLTDKLEPRQLPRASLRDNDARRANVSVEKFAVAVKK